VATTRFTPYQYKLFAFLSVASFFEGYDLIAFSQILPNLTKTMQLSASAVGIMYSVISVGSVAAFFLIRFADRFGRRPILTITIIGYTLFTFATAFATDPITFTCAQFLARVFLIAEWGVAMIYAAEAFPAARRGMVIGVIQSSVGLGAVVCAATAPLLIRTSLQWRAVYLIAIVPLALVIYARRGLKETSRFDSQAKSSWGKRRSLIHIFRTPYAKRVLHLGMIWATAALCANVAIVYWKEFVIAERGFLDGEAGISVAIAAVVALPLVFAAGKMVVRIGRRPGAGVIFLLAAVGVATAYTLEGRALLTAALCLMIFGVSAVPVVLNSFTTELFPTHLRADAFGWCNNLLGRIGYVLGPMLVGFGSERFGNKGVLIASTSAFFVIAGVMVLALMPETGGHELEQTSALEGQAALPPAIKTK
jgi:putative MFS transporter